MTIIDTTDTMTQVRGLSGRAVTFRADPKNLGGVMIRRDDAAWQLYPGDEITLGLYGSPHIGVFSRNPATVYYEVTR